MNPIVSKFYSEVSWRQAHAIEKWLFAKLQDEGRLTGLEFRYYQEKPLITELWQHGVLAARFEIKLILEKADEATP